jgi:hypothetical protein
LIISRRDNGLGHNASLDGITDIGLRVT